MEHRKKPERGLEEVCHFFLSRQSHSGEPRSFTGRNVDAGADETTPLPDVNTRKPELEVVPATAVKQNVCLVFFSDSLVTEKCFVACNLAIEFARRNLSVALVETTTRLPNIFFLLESLFRESPKGKNALSLLEKLLTVPSTLPPPEALQLAEISTGYHQNIKAVFLEKDLDAANSLTILNALKRECDFLIINTPTDILEFKEMISLVSPIFVVLTTVHPEALLGSYSLIEKISENLFCQDVGLLILGESHHLKAKAAFNVIAEMAHKFLSCRIRFMGAVPKGPDFTRSILTRTPLMIESPNSRVSESIKSLANTVTKGYGHPREFSNVKNNLCGCLLS
jgi:cellulose biosynthesis protein BcsQ